jgi:DivIVA domain-containing protein
MLTAAEVEQKTFSTALRGYDLDEVDDFLDEIVATLRTLNEQLDEARAASLTGPMTEPEPAAVAVAEPEIESEPEITPEPDVKLVAEAPAPAIDESAVGRALIAAQTAADRLLEDARSQADRIVEGAKSEADSWSAERDAKRREAEAEIARLTDRVASVRSELSVLADEVADKLDEMDAVIHEGVESEMDTPADSLDAQEAMGGDEPAVERWGYSVEDEPAQDVEPEQPANDHLDAMLTGVANDLQLSSDEPEGQDGSNAEYSEEETEEDE